MTNKNSICIQSGYQEADPIQRYLMDRHLEQTYTATLKPYARFFLRILTFIRTGRF